jgi:hypothetical protein
MKAGMRSGLTALAALAVLATLVLGARSAAAATGWIGPIPETETSRMLGPPVLRGTAEEQAMVRAGYVQEEYLLSGEANVYREQSDGSLAVRTAAIPYTTRLVLVRPKDGRRFNGIVQLGFTHPQLAGNQWARIDEHVLRTGSAYALLVIGGDPGTRERSTPQWPVTTPLLFPWYDPVRYSAFRWPQDDGIRWDVIGQAASRLHYPTPSGPLAGLKVRRIYMSGWSFLGSTVRSWINYGFHDRYRRRDGGPLIDGYLAGISASSVDAGHVPLNSSVGVHADKAKRRLRSIDSPVIELMSEMEALTNVDPQVPDVDGVRGGHRLYELGGTSHGDSGVAGQTRSSVPQLLARRHPGVEPPVRCSVGDSDSPMRDVAQAALFNLDRWVATGRPPPRARRLALAPDGKDFVRDRFGNPLGGVRAAQLDVPLVRYGEPDPSLCGGQVPRRMLKRLPVSAALLRQAYPGGRSDYLARFDRSIEALVRARWLLSADAAAQKRAARRFADQALAQ